MPGWLRGDVAWERDAALEAEQTAEAERDATSMRIAAVNLAVDDDDAAAPEKSERKRA